MLDFLADHGAEGLDLGMGVGSESAGPGDIAVAIGVQGVAAFAKDPAVAVMRFAQGEVIGGDILFGTRESFLRQGELVHEREAEVVFLSGKVHAVKAGVEVVGGFPTDLTAEATFITRALDVIELAHEGEEHGGKEMPILGAAGEKSDQGKFITIGDIDVNDSEVTLTTGGDVEAEAVSFVFLKEFEEALMNEFGDFVAPIKFVNRREGSELLDDLSVFEMNADDGIVITAPFDDRPIHDVVGGSAEGIAHIGLLEDFLQPRAGAAIGNVLFGGEVFVLGAVNDFEEAEVDGIHESGAVVEVPWSSASTGFAGELVKERVFAIMSGPDREVTAPGNATLSGFPEEPSIIMFGELVEPDVAAINGHGLRMGGEGDDAGAVVEFDDTHFNFIGKAAGFALSIEAGDFKIFLPMRDDAFGEIENFGLHFAETHVFERTRIVLGGEEIIAVFVAKAFTDVFETIGMSPADTHGFFGQDDGLFTTGMQRVFAVDPTDLVRKKEAREKRVTIDVN